MPDVGSVTTVLRSETFTHGPGEDEQDLEVHTSLTELNDHHLDFSNLLEKTTIRVFEKVNGINYKLLGIRVFPDDYDVE